MLAGHGAGRVVGRGGHLVSADGRSVGLAWGMAERAPHRSGIGSREPGPEALARTSGLRRVTLDTSQQTEDVYAGLGFRALGVTPDGYGPDLDRRKMVLDL